jgi:hypothetical protein
VTAKQVPVRATKGRTTEPGNAGAVPGPLMRLRVIDIETTGEAPPAEIIEFGRVDVHEARNGWRADRVRARRRGETPGICWTFNRCGSPAGAGF